MNIFKKFKYKKRLKIIERELESLDQFVNTTAKEIYDISYQPNMILFYFEIQHMLPEYLETLKEKYPDFLSTYKVSHYDLFTGKTISTKIEKMQYYLYVMENFEFSYKANFLKGYRITKLNGEVFECSYDDIDELGLNGTTVTWKNKVVELFSKIEPTYEITNKNFKWQWNDKNGVNIHSLFKKQLDNITEDYKELLRKQYEIKQLLNK